MNLINRIKNNWGGLQYEHTNHKFGGGVGNYFRKYAKIKTSVKSIQTTAQNTTARINPSTNSNKFFSLKNNK